MKATKIDLKAFGYENLGWKKLEPGQKPPVGVVWTHQIEGTATVIGPDGNPVQGEIASIDHVSVGIYENPTLGRHVYAQSPAGWMQTFWDQFNGGVLTGMYTHLNGVTVFGTIPADRFLHVTNGKSDNLLDWIGRFVGANNTPDDAILTQMKSINGLEGIRRFWPLPKYQGKPISGTMDNRAFRLIVNDRQSDKVGAIYVPSEILRPNGEENRWIMDVQYDPPMPPTEDHTPEANSKRKDIKFLKSVTEAVFMPWYDLALLGIDGIVMAQAFRMLGAIEVGLLPKE